MYGFGDDFQLSLKDIDFKLNSATGSLPAINFKKTFALPGGVTSTAGYAVPTGDESAPVLLDMTGATIGASLNNATLRTSEFLHVTGSFAFEKGATQVLSAKTVGGIHVPVLANAFTIGASHVQAFLGVG